MLDVLFWGLKASSVAWTSFMEDYGKVNCSFWSQKFLFHLQSFCNFWSSKPWIRIGSGSGSVFSPKCCFRIRIRITWIRIRNTAFIYVSGFATLTIAIFSMVFWNWPKFPLAPLQLPLLAQCLQFLGRLLGALLQLPQDLGVDEVTALHSLLELQRLEETIISSASTWRILISTDKTEAFQWQIEHKKGR